MEEKGMDRREYHQYVWNSALQYLDARADPDVVRLHLTPAARANRHGLADVYRHMLESLTNRQGMPNAIGSIERLRPLFCDFDHTRTLERWSDDWKMLFDGIQDHLRHPPAMEEARSRKGSYWSIFCRGSLSAAQYLGRFDSLEGFVQYVHLFDERPETRPALALLMSHEIFGYGFALACDFLKEIGFSNYAKPDTDVTYIFHSLELCGTNPLDVFRAVSLMAEDVGETAYTVDEAFWLIGSGNLYLKGISFKTRKAKFVEQVRSQWRGMIDSSA